MYYSFRSDELYHHGIKGQKWGVRRTSEQLGNRVEKLENKKARIDTRIEKTRVKNEYRAAKLNRKSSVYQRMATKRMARARTERGIRKSMKLQATANQYSYKADKLIAKNAKLAYKSDKLQKKIDKTNAKIEELNQKKLSEI